jgi:transposase
MEQGMAQRNRSFSRHWGLNLMHPDAAGIDIGSATHYVAVPPDRDDEPVREFASFTADLNALADWLERCGVRIVAMESTGVYWIALYELLQRRGFEVLLVNARHVKNVSGRKSDVLDCQWLQQLLSFGLLRGAFRPDDKVCELRAITRQRAMLLKSQGRHVQHMQKALAQMNIQLANVISDGAKDPSRDRGRRARPAGACGVPRRAHQGQRGRYRQEPARQLASRAPVCAKAGAGGVRLLRSSAARLRH